MAAKQNLKSEEEKTEIRSVSMPKRLWGFVDSDLASLDAVSVAGYFQTLVMREMKKRKRPSR